MKHILKHQIPLQVMKRKPPIYTYIAIYVTLNIYSCIHTYVTGPVLYVCPHTHYDIYLFFCGCYYYIIQHYVLLNILTYVIKFDLAR